MALREPVPWKMRSSMRWPRRDLALCSPSAQRTDSLMLLLPQPLGPTMPVMPGSTFTTVFSAKDLKPWRVIASSRMGDFGTEFRQGPNKKHQPWGQSRVPAPDVEGPGEGPGRAWRGYF